LIGAFTTAVLLVEDNGAFAEDIQTKFTKKVDTTTKKLEKDKIDKGCIHMDILLQDINNLVEKDKLAQTDTDLLLDSGQNIKDTIGCTD
jgi:hypothetical protein